MSIPVQRISSESIHAVRFAESSWPKKHLRKLQTNYGRSPYYDSVMQMLYPIYENPGEYLSSFNIRLIRALADCLGLSPRFHLASELATTSTGTQRLIDLVRWVERTTYISGSGGVNYQDPAAFKAAGLELDIRGYQSIPYGQVENFVWTEFARCGVSCWARCPRTSHLFVTQFHNFGHS